MGLNGGGGEFEDGFGGAAKAVHSGVHLEVDAGRAAVGFGGLAEGGEEGGVFDEDVHIVEDGLIGLDLEEGRHGHDGDADAGIAQGDGFLDGGDGDPVGTVSAGVAGDGNEPVAVGVGFCDESDLGGRGV